ncbi:MAG: hypothetical protein ABGX83_05355 [Nitrospira sp.]
MFIWLMYLEGGDKNKERSALINCDNINYVLPNRELGSIVYFNNSWDGEDSLCVTESTATIRDRMIVEAGVERRAGRDERR